MMTTEFIEGKCITMCPEKERWIREKEGLLHKFEVDETSGGTKPKADPAKTVKCFNRPAAGLNMTDPQQLRPASVLLSTTRYLFTRIATRSDVNWIVVYDFVFDRLRSIRQDIAIQRIDIYSNIQLLELIVRFLVYSSQRLYERSMSEFNAKINNQHLAECITRLIVLYNELEEGKCSSSIDKDLNKLKLNDNRQQMEAVYILLNMGNAEILMRAMQFPSYLRESMDVNLAMKISFAWNLKNYVRVCTLITQLSPLLICAAMISIQEIRRTALKIMSSAYNSKNLTFPGLKLQQLLLYNEIDKVRADCELFGLVFTEQQNILFQKANFKDEVKLAHPEMYYTEKSLHNFLPRILLSSM